MDPRDIANALRVSMMLLAEMVKPMHEWLAGQRTYFLAQGYTEAEARAMAAATYVAVFGQPIHATGPDNPQGTS